MSAVVVVADDDAAIRTVVRQALQRAGYRVSLTDTAAGLKAMVADLQPAVVVTDVILPDGNGLEVIPGLIASQPGLRVIVMSAQNTLSTAVRATEQGAFDYLPKPFDLNELVDAVAAALAGGGDADTADLGDGSPLIGRSAAMQDVYRTIARVVPTELTVMILGESGTGKELVARAIHDMGPRARKPFVAVNMAAIPHELIESELFGHERGAFTGAATRTAGKFEQAQGGTLFLDEIGDMPLAAQTRLLRVLQSGQFNTVGGSRLLSADVRIISATNQNLATLVEKGSFREDLFYRLNVVPVALPPLRAREGDVALLARAFLEQAASAGLPRKALDDGAIMALSQHHWPGNVRELENLMRRLAALERGDTITAAAVQAGLGRQHVPRTEGEATLAEAAEAHIARYFNSFLPGLPPEGVHDRLLADVERPLLLACLNACDGNQLKAAKLLGMNRNTLRKRLTELNIDPNRRS
jgi:two-component system nitrogen regulation response regulator GlnG